MTAVPESQERSGALRTAENPDGAADSGPAPAGFFVPDLIRLEVGRGSRVVVVSDLHLAPTATEVSTRPPTSWPSCWTASTCPGCW